MALLLLRKRLVSGRPSPSAVDSILNRLESEFGYAIAGVRRNARLAGSADVLATLGAHVPVELPDIVKDTQRAQRYSGNLVKLAEKELAKPGGLKIIDRRIDLIVTSENAQAYNDQRRKVVTKLVYGGLGIIEVWDSQLDKRVCEHCAELDGTESVNGEGFPGDAIPGAVHPGCRCTSHFIRTPLH